MEKKEINFVWGKPAPSLLPVTALSSSIQSILSDEQSATDALEYGDSAGPLRLRQEVCKLLSSFYNTPNDVGEVCITGGASQGLVTILQVLTDPACTRRVWMVAPCFYMACRIFEDAGYKGRLRAVPETDEGIDLDFLERSIQEVDDAEHTDAGDGGGYRHLVYLVATFSNPSGRSVPLAHRTRLVEIARAHNALIVTDDIYDFFPNEHQDVLPRLVDIDRSLPLLPSDVLAARNTISNGSFSKLIGPGVRTGWLSTSARLTQLLSHAGASMAGGCPSQLGAAIIAEFLASGAMAGHLSSLMPAYAHRRKLMSDAVVDYLEPLGVRVVGNTKDPKGGYFIWLSLPASLNGKEVTGKCMEEESLAILPGSAFDVSGDHSVTYGGYLRLAYSWADEEDLTEGIRRLAKVISRLICP